MYIITGQTMLHPRALVKTMNVTMGGYQRPLNAD
jgi:hypothetical protein